MRTEARILAWALLIFSAAANAQTPSQSTATGTSNTFNPAISVNGLFLGLHTSEPYALEPAFGHSEEPGHADEGDHADDEGHAHGLPENGGLTVQELEIRMSANVDAYLRADVTLAVPGTEGIELEEGFIESIGLPNLTLRAGKFLSAFGKHNGLHTHAYPFIDTPIANERLLGSEGLNDVGARASLLLPAGWYSELNLELLDGINELFAAQGGSDFAYITNLRNLWDLGEDATFEIGGSYGAGKNTADELTQLLGTDLTLKWRPSRRGSHRALSLQIEYLQARVNDGVDTEKASGLSLHAQLQTSRTWWIQGRYDLFDVSGSDTPRQHRYSALVGWVPSEFSAFRLQYNLNREQDDSVHQVAAQINFTMGSHPAHAY